MLHIQIHLPEPKGARGHSRNLVRRHMVVLQHGDDVMSAPPLLIVRAKEHVENLVVRRNFSRQGETREREAEMPEVQYIMLDRSYVTI